jgi:hypothetical protein
MGFYSLLNMLYPWVRPAVEAIDQKNLNDCISYAEQMQK